MNRLKTVAILFLSFLAMLLQADRSVRVSIHGDLDDDLFVIESDFRSVWMRDCYQMHNPSSRFLYDGRVVASHRIYGMIDFDKRYHLGKKGVLLVMSANEREEIDNRPELLQRTHFKSVELLADGRVLIPSLMPERDDLPGYPLWFGPGESARNQPKEGYNYYKLWENAVVNLGMLFAQRGRYRLRFVTRSNTILFSREIEVTGRTENIRLIGSDPMREVDGSLYDGSREHDARIRQMAIVGVIVERGDASVYIRLPYPFVYINRIFVRGL